MYFHQITNDARRKSLFFYVVVQNSARDDVTSRAFFRRIHFFICILRAAIEIYFLLPDSQTNRSDLDRRNYTKLARRNDDSRFYMARLETMGISFLNTCTLLFDYFLNNGIFCVLSSKMDIFSLVSEIGTTME